MTSKYKISVNTFKCVGSSMCVQTGPAIFGLDKNRQAKVMDENTEDLKNLLAAAESCPTGAITVVEIETGKRLFP